VRARRQETARSPSARSSVSAVADARRWSRSTSATTSPSRPSGSPRSSRRSVAKPELILAHVGERDLTQLDEYRAIGGYQALGRARELEPAAVVGEITDATLRGRGGAGFPMGRKASLIDQKNPRKYVV